MFSFLEICLMKFLDVRHFLIKTKEVCLQRIFQITKRNLKIEEITIHLCGNETFSLVKSFVRSNLLWIKHVCLVLHFFK